LHLNLLFMNLVTSLLFGTLLCQTLGRVHGPCKHFLSYIKGFILYFLCSYIFGLIFSSLVNLEKFSDVEWVDISTCNLVETMITFSYNNWENITPLCTQPPMTTMFGLLNSPFYTDITHEEVLPGKVLIWMSSFWGRPMFWGMFPSLW
jgi:hypothetical protein